MSSVLEIDSVNKQFSTRPVLTDIYLKCKTGDILGIFGRNGSGKSTLLRILFGTLSAENKFIRIDGTVHEQPYKAGNAICYLPQDGFLPEHLTAKKAVDAFLDSDQTDWFFDDPLLTGTSGTTVSAMSGGTQRYLEIKLLLHAPVKFVLLDEPFNGLSPIVIEQVKALIIESAKTRGIILTDHLYRNVLLIANKYCILHDGGLRPFTDKAELIRWGYLHD